MTEVIAGLGSEQADAHPIPGAHSAHEILLHLISWQEIATRALHGEPVPQWPFPEDWPPTESMRWDKSLERLHIAMRDLVEAVEELTEEQLGSIVPGRDYSFYVLLHGIAQHNSYHGGQIALLKKALAGTTGSAAVS